jgi:hypothetical protein
MDERRRGQSEPVAEPEEDALRRRGLFAGAVALVAAGLAKLGGGPARVEAANGDIIHVGDSLTGTATTTLTITGTNVFTAATDAGSIPGIFGINGAGSGFFAAGVGGMSGGNGTPGVVGQANGSAGIGVSGYGSFDALATGVRGAGGANGTGVKGVSNAGSPTADGDGSGIGVWGKSASGQGVRGEVIVGTGLVGVAAGVDGVAILGDSALSYGIIGQSHGNLTYGLLGNGLGQAHGLVGNSQAKQGLVGVTNGPTEFACTLFNAAGSGAPGLFVQGSLVVTGTKSRAVATATHGVRRLYAVEAPENWFEDVGSARLVAGEARVALEPVFAQTVNTEAPYHIFLTPKSGASRGLAVVAQDATGFTVQELQGGTGSYAFDYRILAKMRGEEATRLERFEVPTPPVVPAVRVPAAPAPGPVPPAG